VERYYSPLRYPGGKSKISPLVKEVIYRNNLFDGEYFEVYAGGASIAIDLLLNEFVRRVYINDIDLNIYSFWKSIAEETDQFCDLIRVIPLSVQEWETQRKRLFEDKTATTFQRGFATFYLNRTNISGILRGGLIGGRLQTGSWKMDARFNRAALIDRIQRISRYKNRIAVENLDALVFLEKYKQRYTSRSLIFLDPPYYVKGKDLYLNHYSDSDHIAIKTYLSTLEDAKWLLTYDSVDRILDIYKERRLFTYKLNYSARDSSIGTEVVTFSKSTNIPVTSLAAMGKAHNEENPMEKDVIA